MGSLKNLWAGDYPVYIWDDRTQRNLSSKKKLKEFGEESDQQSLQARIEIHIHMWTALDRNAWVYGFQLKNATGPLKFFLFSNAAVMLDTSIPHDQTISMIRHCDSHPRGTS